MSYNLLSFWQPHSIILRTWLNGSRAPLIHFFPRPYMFYFLSLGPLKLLLILNGAHNWHFVRSLRSNLSRRCSIYFPQLPGGYSLNLFRCSALEKPILTLHWFAGDEINRIYFNNLTTFICPNSYSGNS